VTFADIVRRTAAKGRRSLVLAHRSELLLQALAKLRAVGVAADLEQGSARAGNAGSVVASVATLRGARLAGWARDAFGLIVVDECHHATSAGYRAILSHFAGAHVLGCTATPDRADRQGLGNVFESVAYRYELAAAIRDGWLAPIRARRVKLELDLDQVKTTAGDLDGKQLGEAMTDPAVVAAVAEALLDQAGDRRTIVFTVNVAHAHAVAEALNQRRPGSARAVSGQSTDEERAAAAADLAAGRYQFAANAALWTEGFDLPAVACIGLARPTKSRGLYTQCVGRGTRLAEGKADCLVLDFTGNTSRHRLIGPADVLAGDDVSEAVKKRVADRLDEEGDPLEYLEHELAEEEQQAAAAQRESRRVRWVAEEIADLFGEQLALDPDHWPDPATGGQLETLVKAGMDSIPSNLTKGQASELIGMLIRRREQGLCTLKQARLLRRFGVKNTDELTLAAASALINIKLGKAPAQPATGGP
jgi:superfamily II DNA or RNA helicase